MEQVILDAGTVIQEQSKPAAGNHSVWGLTLVLVPCLAALSAVVFITQLTFLTREVNRKLSGPPHVDGGTPHGKAVSWKAHVDAVGGTRVFCYKSARLAIVLALLVITAVRVSGPSASILSILICATYGYATSLAILDVAAKRPLGRLASMHLTAILFLLVAVYAVRDVWPLMTFTLEPIDGHQGCFIWIVIALLGVAGVIVPLCVPRQYEPIEGEIPQQPDELNEEQTASLLSFGTFSYLDRLVMLGYRLRNLSFEQLPPLPDYDRTSYLVKRSFKHLDPFSGAPRRHLFIGILKTFFWQYMALVLLQVLRVAASLFAPIGINRLLKYIETDGQDAVVRPFVWIVLMFLGPCFASLLTQWYVFTTTSNVVRIRAIITQLVFEHALRIRLFSGDSASENGDSGAATAAKEDGSNQLGKINNLVTTDLENIADGRELIWLTVYSPLLVATSIYFLYELLGWSVFVGIGVMLLSFIIPGYTAKRLSGIQKQVMSKTDARVQKVTEVLQVIRMVKLFGWEHKVNEILTVKRDEELRWVRLREVAQLIINLVNYTIPLLQMISIFATFTVLMKRQLTPSIVFSSIPVFELIRNEIHYTFLLVPKMMQANVSLERLRSFLHNTELTDEFTAPPTGDIESVPSARPEDPWDIGMKNASFTWSKNAATKGSQTPSSRSFTLRVTDEVVFKRGAINLIVGPTGSGKTSLLMALLGELHFTAMGPDSWVNLPRDGGVAYAVQESWVQNDTIRNNILFGAPYDAERYRKVIDQCALSRDLTLFAGGDHTEVGEKGLTLSGGQKARITLARAIYSSAEILLLDDVLAALDVHTARWIVDKCLKGDLVRGRTVILVTHNVPLASSVASFMVTLSGDGTIFSYGSVSDVMASDADLAQEVEKQAEELKRADQLESMDVDVDAAAAVETAQTVAAGKLVVEEEVLEGHVTWSTLSLYFNALGGKHYIIFWTLFLGGHVASDVIHSVHTYWLGVWAQAYENQDAGDVNVGWYLGVFAALVLAFSAVLGPAVIIYIFGMFRASKQVHRQLVTSVLGTTMRVLDSTPTSRIIARCTQDMRTIDGPFPEEFHAVVELTSILVIRLCSVVFVTPIFIIPGLLVFVAGAGLGHLYMTSQLAVKRHSSNKAAPVLAHFGGTIHGLASIRAYGAQAAMRAESYSRMDEFTRASRTYFNLNRWIGPRLDGISGLCAAGLGAWLIYGPGRGTLPRDVGFALSMAIGFSTVLLYWVRLFNRMEVLGNSLERINSYVNLEQEPEPAVPRALPAAWPTSGDLRVQGLSSRYSPDGPRVLHEVNFEVKSGERVGIVGRTGSGKSSLTLSLLRCIYTEGAIFYDGIDTSTIDLDSLRSNITIIPQVPELLSGTLRENLDLFGEHDDATLNAALRASGLFSLQKDSGDDNRITLDSQISSGGGNLSIGQRQILALARALVRGSKLLILDEATSSIDYETDTIIQSSLRHELGGDVTVLIVAHRLQTIMDADKIMVLDAGNIVEFDSPRRLLEKDGLFKALVEESSERDALYAMVR